MSVTLLIGGRLVWSSILGGEDSRVIDGVMVLVLCRLFVLGAGCLALGFFVTFFFFQAEDGIRDLVRSRGLGDVYKRQPSTIPFQNCRKVKQIL